MFHNHVFFFCKLAQSHPHLAKLRSKAFLSSFLLGTKAGSHCCEQPLKTTEDDEEEKEEVTVSLATASVSIDAAVTAVNQFNLWRLILRVAATG